MITCHHLHLLLLFFFISATYQTKKTCLEIKGSPYMKNYRCWTIKNNEVHSATVVNGTTADVNETMQQKCSSVEESTLAFRQKRIIIRSALW